MPVGAAPGLAVAPERVAALPAEAAAVPVMAAAPGRAAVPERAAALPAAAEAVARVVVAQAEPGPAAGLPAVALAAAPVVVATAAWAMAGRVPEASVQEPAPARGQVMDAAAALERSAEEAPPAARSRLLPHPRAQWRAACRPSFQEL